MSEPTLASRFDFDVEHVAGYEVDAEPLLAAFGIGIGMGVVSVNLEIKSDKKVELTVRRYITREELGALRTALNETKPELIDVTSVAFTPNT